MAPPAGGPNAPERATLFLQVALGLLRAVVELSGLLSGGKQQQKFVGGVELDKVAVGGMTHLGSGR